MPRRSILSAAERAALLAIPCNTEDLIRLYAFNDADLALVRQHCGAANRLRFAVQLCYLRFPAALLRELPSPEIANPGREAEPQTSASGRRRCSVKPAVSV